MAHSLYTLSFGSGEDTAVFYVGCTNDVKRREAEHRNNPFNENHNEYNTFKYQFIRKLREVGMDFAFTALHQIEEDADSEYEWVLQFARANQAAGRTFIDGHPLTNMKAGDFLSEILNRPEVRTRSDIVQYCKTAQENRMRSLERAKGEVPSPKANPAWDKLRAELAANKKPERHYTMSECEADPERIERLRKQTEAMMKRQAELDAQAK